MSLALFLIPLVSLVALIVVYIVLANIRSSHITDLKNEHEQFMRAVIDEDAAIQDSLLTDLLEGQPPAERLAAFEKARAALLPGARLDEPAAWDADELAECTRSRFARQVANLNRKVGFSAGVVTVAIIAACVVSSAVLYNFQPGTAIPPTGSVPASGYQSDPTPAHVPGALPSPLPTAAPPSDPTQSAPSIPNSIPGAAKPEDDRTATSAGRHRWPIIA